MRTAIVLILAASLAVGCSSRPSASLRVEKPDPATVTTRPVDEINDLGIRLLREVRAGDASENAAISPPSIALALTLLLNGAEGATHATLERLLRAERAGKAALNAALSDLIYRAQQTDQEPLSLSAAVWMIQPISVSESFAKEMGSKFGARVERIGSAGIRAQSEIDKWVKSATRGRISQFTGEIDKSAPALITTAMAFDGVWLQPFDRELTRPGQFNLASGKTTAQFMSDGDGMMSLARRPTFDLVIRPFRPDEGKTYALALVVPKGKETPDSLLKQATGAGLRELLKSVEPAELILRVPRHQTQMELDLLSALDRVAGGGIAAKLTDLRALAPDLSATAVLSRLNHAVAMQMDEEGVRAAAATEAIPTIQEDGPPEITLDRPFIYAIVDMPSGAIVLLGVCDRPVDPQ